MGEPARRRSWFGLNRRWLGVLPAALVVLLVGSGYHLRTFWYDNGLHRVEARGSVAAPLRVVDPFTDAEGPTRRVFTIRLDSVEDVDSYPVQSERTELPAPAGTRAVTARLDFRAAPGQTLTGCQVALVDSAGRHYEVPDPVAQSYRCVPEDHPGPDLAQFSGSRRGAVKPGEARPRTWSTAPVFLVADDARITKVLVWWRKPRYVELTVRR